MTTPSPIQRKSAFRFVIIAIFVSTIIAGILLLPVRQYLVDALGWAQGLGAWGPLFVALSYIMARMLLLPGSDLILRAAFLFGVPVGLLSAWTGATLVFQGNFLHMRAGDSHLS